MCGRTACTLGPDALRRACVYKDGVSGELRCPSWAWACSAHTAHYNVSPGALCPVLLPASRFPRPPPDKDADPQGPSDPPNRPLLSTMLWNFNHGKKLDKGAKPFVMNNAKLETLQTSTFSSARTALVKGNRCVVLVDGFYEWKPIASKSPSKGTAKKTPYFIHAAQPAHLPQPFDFSRLLPVEKESRSQAYKEEPDEGPAVEWTGRRLLRLAGVFEVRPGMSGDVLAFAVVTLPSGPALAAIHDRMPAVLTPETEAAWLDVEGVRPDEALNLLRPDNSLQHFVVDHKVGNGRVDSPDCVARAPSTKGTLLSFFGPVKRLKDGAGKAEGGTGPPAEKKPRQDSQPTR